MSKYVARYQKLHAGEEGYLVNGKEYLPSGNLFTGGNFIKKLFADFRTVVNRSPKGVRVLDYGCGKALHLWQPIEDGKSLHQLFKGKLQSYYCYDPGYEPYTGLPDPGERFDIVICADVMEHVPLEEIPETLTCIDCHLSYDGVALLTISGKPARKAFLDGENLHCTLLPFHRWIELLDEYFTGKAYKLIYEDERGERVHTNAKFERLAATV